jgi:hypothetical protein
MNANQERFASRATLWLTGGRGVPGTDAGCISEHKLVRCSRWMICWTIQERTTNQRIVAGRFCCCVSCY